MPESVLLHSLSAEQLEALRARLADDATRPDFDAPSSARLCSCPVQLTGSSRTVDTSTGEVISVFSSDQLPERLLTIACGNRRETVCPACSKVYAADAYQLVTAGLVGGKSVPATVKANARVFATFTAPTFGRIHLGPDKRGAARPCHPRRDGSGCNRWHKPGDPRIGQPLHADTYDYAGAVLWNASASALWARFTINLRRDLARLAGLTVAEFSAQASMVYAKVAEYQARGSIHFHAVIRVDGADGPGSPAPSWATTDLLSDAINQAAARTVVTTPDSPDVPSMPIKFGTQLDLRPIATDDLRTGELSERAVAGYIAKYATKSAHSTGALDRPVYCRQCSGAGRYGTYQDGEREISRICRGCLGSGLAVDLADLQISEHIRTMVETAFSLGAGAGLAALKLRRWAHMLGFRGHFLSKARRYSVTFALLRGARREHARQERADYLAAFGLLDDTAISAETIVVGSWAYAGRAINPHAAIARRSAP